MIARLARVPPAVFLTPVVIGIVVNVFVGAPFLPTGAALGAGLPILAGGTGLAIWAVGTMLAQGENPDARRPKNRVVTAGPFRFSRNPMYLGFETAALGAGLVMNSVAVIVSVGVSVALTQVLVVHQEERYLAAKFGHAYSDYRRRVRRWF